MYTHAIDQAVRCSYTSLVTIGFASFKLLNDAILLARQNRPTSPPIGKLVNCKITDLQQTQVSEQEKGKGRLCFVTVTFQERV